MLPTLRLYLLLLLSAAFVAGVGFSPAFIWLAAIYLALLVILLVVDYLLSVKTGDLDVERINDARLSLGAENPVTLLIANRSPRAVRLTLRDEHPPEIAASAVFVHGDAPAYGLLECRYTLRPVTRGDFGFGAINARWRSPFGMLLLQGRYAADAPVKVYPNVLDVRTYDLLARKGMLIELGLRPARVFGQGSEFERLREYTTDDEFRRINWKATARRGKPIAAEYETERSQYVMCAIDTGRLMRSTIGDLAKLDYAINAALLLSYVVTLKGDHVGMLSFADDVRGYIGPKRGKGQFHRMLEGLYNIQSEPVEANYTRALAYLALKQKRRSLIVVFTDLVTLDAARPLIAIMARLAQHHLALCVVMSDPNISGLAGHDVRGSDDVYRRAVAEQLLDERRVVLDTLQRSGVLTIDTPADKLSVALISKYLELKARGSL